MAAKLLDAGDPAHLNTCRKYQLGSMRPPTSSGGVNSPKVRFSPVDLQPKVSRELSESGNGFAMSEFASGEPSPVISKGSGLNMWLQALDEHPAQS